MLQYYFKWRHSAKMRKRAFTQVPSRYMPPDRTDRHLNPNTHSCVNSCNFGKYNMKYTGLKPISWLGLLAGFGWFAWESYLGLSLF